MWDRIGAVTDAFWGVPALVLFVGGGLYATVRLRGIQFRGLVPALRLAVRNGGAERGTGSLAALAAS
ncbi:MAG: sodium:alanine symporter family protein, partial [Oscillospiraceae bacterium]|nr:sodium:alanine symporter family protein [Oscillospiraceae bacterium]